jgi:group I intron endonuclease
MKTIGIYTITNNTTNKVYIGCSKNIKARLLNHKSFLKKNKHANMHLQRAFNKYGEESFDFEILEECKEEYLYSQEHYWCNLLNVHNRQYGYNILGTTPTRNCIFSDETKLKMSIARKGLIRSKEHCNNISIGKKGMTSPNLGKKHSEATKLQMRKSHLGKLISEETRKKHSVRMTGKISSCSKSVLQFDLNNNFIKEFKSITDASKELKISRLTIINSINKIHRKNKLYIWKIKQ